MGFLKIKRSSLSKIFVTLKFLSILLNTIIYMSFVIAFVIIIIVIVMLSAV